MEQTLVHLNIVRKLSQLEAHSPGFLERQLTALTSYWDQAVPSLAQLIENQQWEEASSVLHKMKGHAGMLGLNALQDQCAALEEDCKNRHWRTSSKKRFAPSLLALRDQCLSALRESAAQLRS